MGKQPTVKVFNSKFAITETYHGKEDSVIEVKILLDIDYANKSYKILNKRSGNQFQFVNSLYSESWKAINRCIAKAIDFAEKELKEVK